MVKDIAYWINRIEEDIYEPDKIIIEIGHLRKLLKTTNVMINGYAKCTELLKKAYCELERNALAQDLCDQIEEYFFD